ncbi:MAG: hypothetical protein KGS47_07165 [Chloroflexi bacterium]|nr:hypothetical protein [Chloroflexota bacterium]
MAESARSFAEPIAALRQLFAAAAAESEAAVAAVRAGNLVAARAVGERLAECDRSAGALAGAIAEYAATLGLALDRRADSLDDVVALDQRLAAHQQALLRRDRALALLPEVLRLEHTREAGAFLLPLVREVKRVRTAIQAGDFALAEALCDGRHALAAVLAIARDRDTLGEDVVAELGQQVAASTLGSRIAFAAIAGRLRLRTAAVPVVPAPTAVPVVPAPAAVPARASGPSGIDIATRPAADPAAPVVAPRVSPELLQRLSEHFRPSEPTTGRRASGSAGPGQMQRSPAAGEFVRDERSTLGRIVASARAHAQFIANQITGTKADLSDAIDRAYAAALVARARRSSWPALARGYALTGDAGDLAHKALATPRRELPEPLVRLLAWSQSILRSAAIDSLGGGTVDATQLMLYDWLIILCRRRRIYLAQYMSLETQAPVSDLTAAYEEYGRLAALLAEAQPARSERGARLRAVPAPTRDARPQPPPEPTRDARPQPASRASETLIERVARWLRGRSILFVGGERRPEYVERHTRTFGLREFIWATGDRGPTPAQFEADIARDDVAVVVLAIRWSRHSFGDIRQACQRHGKPLVRLRAGYNEHELARNIEEQAGARLALNATTV